MNQIIIINNKLKMSKGKIARVCFGLGYSLPRLGMIDKLKWLKNGSTAITLKSDNLDVEIKILNDNNIKFVKHIDAGRTEVPEGSLCGIAFVIDPKKIILSYLKLL